MRDTPFPLAAARDLLGVVRSLYAAAKRREAGQAHLRRLEAVGRDLHAAIVMARRYPKPDSLGHQAAWTKAERATAELGRLVDAFTSLHPTVEATSRVLRPGLGGGEPSKLLRRRMRG